MKIIAKTTEGKEFFYSRINSYSVPEKSCNRICKALNNAKWDIKDNEKWLVYDISKLDLENLYASFQKMFICNGKIIISSY